MLVPMIAWALTGLVFFIKPGYDGAYEALELKTYPLENRFSIQSNKNWQEIRLIRSILGYHLLVKSDDVFFHLDPTSLELKPVPDKSNLMKLFEDTVSQNRQRYGSVEEISGTTALTTTGVTVVLDWQALKFDQHGVDREIIGLLYKVHYLQWTPWPFFNQVLVILGLLLLVTLTLLGVKLFIQNRP